MNKLITTLLFFVLAHLFAFSQTYSFTNTTTANINSTATTSRTIAVTGVPTTGMVLRQVNISFGNMTSMYSGDLSGFTLKLTDPAGNVINLLSPTSFTASTSSNADHKAFNIHMRDHAALKTPQQAATATGSTVSKGYPFNYGYYKPEGTFNAFNTTNLVNGNWIFSMSGYTTSYGRTFNRVELIFGDPIQVTDIRATAPNQSCDTKQCLQTGDVFWSKNTGYPNGQGNTPLQTNGCQWNSEQNNSSWFYFTASASTAKLSVSGFSTPQETSVFKSPDCTSFSIAAGGCAPSELYASSPSMEKYYMGNYASGYSYNQGYDLSGLVPGETYIFIVDGQAGTESEFYVEMVSGADNGCCTPPSLTMTSTESSCTTPTGTATVTATGGTPPFTYLWSDGQTSATATGLAPGSYSVTVSSSPTCSIDATVTIATPNSLTVTTAATTPASCGLSNGEITTTVTGGTAPYTYLWSNGATTQNLTGVAAGTYTLTVTDANTCTGTNGTGVTITSPNGPTVITTITTPASCGATDGEITTTVSGGTAPYTYSWSNGATTQNLANVGAGTYTLTVTDDNGCEADNGTGITLANANAPTVNITSTNSTCNQSNGSATATATGGAGNYTYLWTPNGETTASISILSAGNYSVTVTDNLSCTTIENVSINSSGGINAQTSSENAVCGTSLGSLSATASGGDGNYTYTWQPGNLTGAIQTNLPPGTYTLTVTDGSACSTTATQIIDMTGSLNVQLTPANSIINGGESVNLFADLTPPVPGVTYSWTPSAGLSCTDCPNPIATPSQTTNYEVTATAPDGCSGKANAKVKIKIICGDFFVPSIFSPNGDGKNDFFEIHGNCITAMDLRIYDRWGELVFKTEDQSISWDGTYKGQMMNPASFVYTLSITTLNSETINLKGNVSLVK